MTSVGNSVANQREDAFRALVLKRYRWCSFDGCLRLSTVAVRMTAAPDVRYDVGNGIGYCERHGDAWTGAVSSSGSP